MAKGWRWSLWEILWMAGPVFLLMFATMPETSAANILLRRARRLRALTGNQNLKSQSEIDQGAKTMRKVITDSFVIPIKIFLLDPAVTFTNVYTSLIYGILLDSRARDSVVISRLASPSVLARPVTYLDRVVFHSSIPNHLSPSSITGF
jgi:hypothetical protein